MLSTSPLYPRPAAKGMSEGNQHNPTIVCIIYNLLSFLHLNIGRNWAACGKHKISEKNLVSTFTKVSLKNKVNVLYLVHRK